MAPSHVSSYDPVKTVEGMFNGTLARLGQFFKDPQNYGAKTKAVLTETSKRYQDALDDCEIQILEAKWYLENMLEVNRARREIEARKEDAPVAKRKLEEMEGKELMNNLPAATAEHLAKRPRLGANTLEAPKDTSAELARAAEYAQEPAQPAPEPDNSVSKVEVIQRSSPQPAEPTHLKSAPETTRPTDAPVPAAPPESRPSTSAGPQQSTQGTPANEYGNFTSMFCEASNEETTEANFPFNLGLDTDPADMNNMAFADGDQDHNQSSLNSLLPGVESYAKQTDTSNGPQSTFNFNMGGNGAEQNGIEVTNFDLPEMPNMPNSFDEFLEDNNLGDSFGGGEGTDDFLDGGNLMDIDDLDISFIAGT